MSSMVMGRKLNSFSRRAALLAVLLATSASAATESAGAPWAASAAPQASDTTRIEGAFQTWRTLSASDRLPFESYAGFLMQYPDWPDSDKMRRAAEGAINVNRWSPSQVVAFFDRLPPLTNAGRARYAIALASGPDTLKAADWARQAWRAGALTPDDESRLMGLFGSSLTPDDHDARMDALLGARATTAAQRQFAFTSPAMRPVYGARLAMQARSADAATLVAAAPPGAMADAGFVADRCLWLRATGSGWQARELLANRPALVRRPADVEKWYELLLTFAREAYADRQYDAAFRIAGRVDDALPIGADASDQPLGVRDDYTSLTWLAGRAALIGLGRPADALPMFLRYAGGAKSPQTISKGHYWAAKAAQAARDEAAAQRSFAAAAALYDQFYGQLALEALGRPLPPVARPDLNGAGKPDSRPLFQAAAVAGRFGSWQDQTRFVRAIAANAKSESEHRDAVALSAYLGRPDLAVMAGRSARVNELATLVAPAYPTVSVPEDRRDSWTMIHAISRQESQFDRNAISHAGARGLMQLMPGTARETAGRIALSYDAGALTSDPQYNIRLGSTYFQSMLRYYNGSYPLAIAAYNAGPGNVNKWIAANGDPRIGGADIVRWIEDIPIYETRNYVQRVLENAVMYDHLNPERAQREGPMPLSTYLGKRTPG